jgi:hypothetical protein
MTEFNYYPECMSRRAALNSRMVALYRLVKEGWAVIWE